MRKSGIIALTLAVSVFAGCSASEKSSSVPVFGASASSPQTESGSSSESASSSSAVDFSSSNTEHFLSPAESTSTSTESSSTSAEIASAGTDGSSANDAVSLPNTASTTTIISGGKEITVELDENGKIPYKYRSSTGVVWDYPIKSNLTYNFASGKIIKGLEERYGKTGKDLGYTGEWCAEVISDLLIKNGYKISPKYNPCDLAIQLLNKNYAHFYCIREENFDSLVQYGLSKKGQDRVIMTTSEEFTPKRGDLVCFLWNEENDVYNWSHIGIVAEDYDGTVLRTIEGNVGVSEFPDDPRIRSVGGREREYNETVVGFIRLDK